MRHLTRRDLFRGARVTMLGAASVAVMPVMGRGPLLVRKSGVLAVTVGSHPKMVWPGIKVWWSKTYGKEYAELKK